MNREVVKCGLFLLGGIAIGAIGATVVSRGKLKGIKPIASDLLSRGYDVREKVLEKVDAAREDILTCSPKPRRSLKNAVPIRNRCFRKPLPRSPLLKSPLLPDTGSVSNTDRLSPESCNQKV